MEHDYAPGDIVLTLLNNEIDSKMDVLPEGPQGPYKVLEVYSSGLVKSSEAPMKRLSTFGDFSPTTYDNKRVI